MYRRVFVIQKREVPCADETVSSVISGPANDENRFLRIRKNFSDRMSARKSGELHQLVNAEAILGEQLLVEEIKTYFTIMFLLNDLIGIQIKIPEKWFHQM